MALIDRVTARVPNQRLVELTNQDDTTATTYSATVLAACVADATADLEVLAGVEYDDSDARHIFTAVHGVLYYLMVWRGFEVDVIETMRTRWENLCLSLAKVTHRNRIQPTTSSVLTPSSEQVDGETVRPDTDREYFNGLIPAPPTRGYSVGRPGLESNA